MTAKTEQVPSEILYECQANVKFDLKQTDRNLKEILNGKAIMSEDPEGDEPGESSTGDQKCS